MAFGQQAGPPATARQVRELLSLLQDAGHLDFRDARGPMGFTQRQAGGKFTRDEAEALIARLSEAAERDDGQAAETNSQGAADPAPSPVGPARRLSQTDRTLQRISSEQLAAELQRRGWIVAEP